MKRKRLVKMCEIVEAYAFNLRSIRRLENLTTELALLYAGKVSMEEAIKEVKDFCTRSPVWPKNDEGNPIGEKAARNTPPGILLNRFSVYCRTRGYNDENNLFQIKKLQELKGKLRLMIMLNLSKIFMSCVHH